MIGLCLIAGDTTTRIATTAFTLVWLHTIEHTRWEEDWQVEPDQLVLVEARIEGSGAGMEPPPEAHLSGGRYVWRPEGRALAELVLRRAPQVRDWRLCTADGCATLAARIGNDADPVTLKPCE